jgi:hypothetical protein
MKVGMIGLDTSHCSAFASMLNDAAHEYHVPGSEVIAAYPGGSDQFSLSRDRVEGFTEALKKKYGIMLYDSIEDLARDVDAILLESVDGRQHLLQFRQAAMGKPVFIDKPFAVSAAEAREIIKLAHETNTPIMSCSSLRYAAGIMDLVGQDEQVVSCETFGPAPIVEDYPGLFWYGIHSAEILFSFMGPGCEETRCIPYRDMDVAIGEWRDGRIGIVRGTRFEKGEYGCVIHTDSGAKSGVAKQPPPFYYCLLQKIVEFFETGVSAIDIEETFGIVSFLEAADRSKERGGTLVHTEAL